jgi:hypothetical protein
MILAISTLHIYVFFYAPRQVARVRRDAMSRNFFHLMDHEHIIRDENGVELQGLSAAHLYGLKLQRQILLYSPDEPCD